MNKRIPKLLFLSFALALPILSFADEAKPTKVIFIGDSIARQGSSIFYKLPFAVNFREAFNTPDWELNYIAAGGSSLKDWMERPNGTNQTDIGLDAFTPSYKGWPNGQSEFQNGGGKTSVSFPFIGSLTKSVNADFIILELGTNAQYLMGARNQAELQKQLITFAEQLRAAKTPPPKIFWVTPHKLPNVSQERQDHFFKTIDAFLRRENLGEALDGRIYVNSEKMLRAKNDPHLSHAAAKIFADGITSSFKEFVKRQREGAGSSSVPAEHSEALEKF